MLGPLLFLILIGDIDKELASAFLSSFADDTRMGHSTDSTAETRAISRSPTASSLAQRIVNAPE